MRRKHICAMCGVNPRQEYSHSYCRECHNKKTRDRRHRVPLTPEQARKDNARSYAGEYLRRGLIEKKNCQNCGDVKSQMHHDDYGKPLEVVWLCRKCHMGHHKGLIDISHLDRNKYIRKVKFKEECSSCGVNKHPAHSRYCNPCHASRMRNYRAKKKQSIDNC